MNMREGRIGRAESVAAAWMAMMISGIFAVNTTATYTYGNASYITSLLSAGLSLAAFMLVACAMQRLGKVDLYGFLSNAVGKPVGGVFSAVLAISLVLAAVFPPLRMFIIMHRYIYSEANLAAIVAYLLPCILFFSCTGLETIGRTMRVYIGIVVISFLVAMLISRNSYESFRLYPILGNGLRAILPLSVTGMSRFLPALISLLICGKGLQGVDNVVKSGRTAVLFAALITALTQLCLGMAFDYTELASMHSPMYRLLMSVEGGSPYARTDKLLLFFWTTSSLLTSGFYVYAASLLYTRALRMRDVRPSAVCFSVMVSSFVLFGQMNLPAFEAIAMFLWEYLWLLLLAPLCAAALISIWRKKETA